jgi:hypothetical protein
MSLLIAGQNLNDKANDSIYDGLPSNQAAVDLVDGWVCGFPPSANVVAGQIDLFDDARIKWGIDALGGVGGASVLELGPLEASHSYMLEKAGVAHVTAIEANQLCYLKCLIAKEILDLTKTKFLLGNFLDWLKASQEQFDVIFASGVLYHMIDPIELIQIMGERTEKLFLWTHYVADRDEDFVGPWADAIARKEVRNIRGRDIPYYLRPYGDVLKEKTYCGGVHQHTTWLKRSDILTELALAGFTRTEVAFEDGTHPHGPSFAVVAMK